MHENLTDGPWIAERLPPLRERLAAATSPHSAISVVAPRLHARAGRDLRGRRRRQSSRLRADDPRAVLGQKFPRGSVDVEFLIPGFSANWGPHADTVERNISRFDAMVIIYATRTTFGEWVRDIARKAGKPFRTCGRQERGAVLHTVTKVVENAVLREEP